MGPTDPDGLRAPGRGPAAAGLAAALTVAAVWTLLSPEERTMGAAIRPVYLHVSATWAGLLFLYGTAVVGLGQSTGLVRVTDPWLRRAWLAGLLAFTVGFLISFPAAEMSWGGILWSEPRVRASVGAVLTGVIAFLAHRMLAPARWGGLIWVLGALGAGLMVRQATLVLHPQQPIQDVTPWAIRGTFYGLTLVWCAAMACLALLIPRGWVDAPADAA